MRKWPTQVGTVVADVGRELSLLKMAINMANADNLTFFLWNELEPRCQQRAAGSLELTSTSTSPILTKYPLHPIGVTKTDIFNENKLKVWNWFLWKYDFIIRVSVASEKVARRYQYCFNRCWWPGDPKIHSISSNDISLGVLEHSGFHIAWLLGSTGHQHTWYWPWRIIRSLCFTRKVYKDLFILHICRISSSLWLKLNLRCQAINPHETDYSQYHGCWWPGKARGHGVLKSEY